MKSVQEYYDKRTKYYNLFYARAENIKATKRELRFLHHIFTRHSARRIHTVLDVACGGGRHANGLAQEGYGVTGMDLSRERIKMAQSNARRQHLHTRFRQGDMRKIPFQNRFDAVIALYCIFFLTNDADVKRALRGFYRALRRDGLLVLHSFNALAISRTLKETQSVHLEQKGIVVMETSHNTFDEIEGNVYGDTVMMVKDHGKTLVFKDKEVIRPLTYRELRQLLAETGFQNIRCYPDFKTMTKGRKAESIVLLATR